VGVHHASEHATELQGTRRGILDDDFDAGDSAASAKVSWARGTPMDVRVQTK